MRRAFKKHKQVDPLVLPGTADLTADVDFSVIKEVSFNSSIFRQFKRRITGG